MSMNVADKLTAIKKCGVLAPADEASLEWLAEAAQTETFDVDQVVSTEGETSTNVYIVAWGALQVRVGESCKLVSFAEAGTLFGEYAMFAKGVRTAHVVTSEPTALLSIDAEKFKEFLLRCPTVLMQLFETAVRRLQRAERTKS